MFGARTRCWRVALGLEGFAVRTRRLMAGLVSVLSAALTRLTSVPMIVSYVYPRVLLESANL